MKRTDVEQLVRQMSWPEPPASLRARVLSDIPIAARPMAGAARVAGIQDPARRTRIAPDDARSGHGWRRASILVGLGILIMLGSCTGFDVWANREVEAEIARIEARYGSLDVKTQTADVPAADNRARMVRAAAALAVGLQDRPYHYLAWPMPSPLPANLRAFAEANREAVRLAAEIRNRHQSNWERRAGERSDVPGTNIMILGDAIAVSALIDIEAGQADEAASLIVSGLGISASMRAEFGPDRWLVSRLLQVARQLLTTSAPSKAALRDVAWWLTENEMPDGMRPAILENLKRGHDMFARMEHGDIDRDTARVVYPESWPDWPSAFLGLAAQIGRPFVRTAHLRYLQYMTKLLDLESAPPPRPALEEPPPPQSWAFVDRLTHRFTDGHWGYSEAGDEFMSQLGAAEVAVALRRFKLDHQAYPDDLSALSPTYLLRVPIDPFTGQPPVYARQGDGFTLRAKPARPGGERWGAFEWNVPR